MSEFNETAKAVAKKTVLGAMAVGLVATPIIGTVNEVADAATPQTVTQEQQQLDIATIFNDINDYRESLGLKRLKFSTTISTIAQKEATRAATSGDLNHSMDFLTNPAAGQWKAAGEITALSGKTDAHRFLKFWKASSAHNDIMTRADVDVMGIGVHAITDSKGFFKYVATVDFYGYGSSYTTVDMQDTPPGSANSPTAPVVETPPSNPVDNLPVGEPVTPGENTGGTGGTVESETPVVDETPDTPEVPETPDTPVGTPATPDTPDAPATPDVPDAPIEWNPDTDEIIIDLPELPVTPTPDTPDTPEVPETPDTPDVPETPDTPDTPDVPDVPDVPVEPTEPPAPVETPDNEKLPYKEPNQNIAPGASKESLTPERIEEIKANPNVYTVQDTHIANSTPQPDWVNTVAVTGPIGDFYHADGAANKYGNTISEQVNNLYAGGSSQAFENNISIFHHVNTGAHAIKWDSPIGQYFQNNNSETGLGYPFSNEVNRATSSYQKFRDPVTGVEKTVFYSESTGAHAVNHSSEIGKGWQKYGGEFTVGKPTTDLIERGDGLSYQQFQTEDGTKNIIFSSESTGTYLITETSPIGQAWLGSGGEYTWGVPVTNAFMAHDGSIHQRFSNGVEVSYNKATGVTFIGGTYHEPYNS